MNTPTEEGYYWADIYGDDEWEPVELFNSGFFHEWRIREFEYEESQPATKVRKWGGKMERTEVPITIGSSKVLAPNQRMAPDGVNVITTDPHGNETSTLIHVQQSPMGHIAQYTNGQEWCQNPRQPIDVYG